jgi:hypothetical protein
VRVVGFGRIVLVLVLVRMIVMVIVVVIHVTHAMWPSRA